MSQANIELLTAALQAVCPIQGVSVGRWSDKSTWRIDFDPSATAPQRTAAQGVVDNWDPTAPTAEETRQSALVADTDRQTIVTQIQNATPTQIKNYINNNVTDLASAKQMLIRLALLVARYIKD